MRELTEVKPLWADKSLKMPYIIRRYNERGMRNYHTFFDNQIHYVSSVTSITKVVMPTNEGLIRWISEHGKVKAEQIAKEAANYGTLMHIAMSQFLIRGFFDFDAVDDLIQSFILEERIKHSTYGWADRLKADVKAFEVFVKEHNVKPLAIEIPLISFDMHLGGTLDLVCEMTIGSGQNGAILKTDIKKDNLKRITVVIDWKSGRHGFYPEHEVQLHLYKMMFEENFSDINIDSVFNWAPKDWQSEPDYLLKCQDNSIERFNIPAYLQIFNNYNAKQRDVKHAIITGVAYLDSVIEPVKFKSTEDILKEKFYSQKKEKDWVGDYFEEASEITSEDMERIQQSLNAINGNGEKEPETPESPEKIEEEPIIKPEFEDLVVAVRNKVDAKKKTNDNDKILSDVESMFKGNGKAN